MAFHILVVCALLAAALGGASAQLDVDKEDMNSVPFQLDNQDDLEQHYTEEFNTGLTIQLTITGRPVEYELYINKLNIPENRYETSYENMNDLQGKVTLTIPGVLKDDKYRFVMSNNKGVKIKYNFEFKNKNVPFCLMPQFSENQTFSGKPENDLRVNFVIKGNPGDKKVPSLTMNGKELLKTRYEVSVVPIEFPYAKVTLTVKYADTMTGQYQLIMENDMGDKSLSYNFSYVEVPFCLMPQFSENQTFYGKPGRDFRVNFVIKGNPGDKKVPSLTMNGKELSKTRYEVSMVPMEFPFVNVSLTVWYADPMTGSYQLIMENDMGDKLLSYNCNYIEVIFRHFQTEDNEPIFVTKLGDGLTFQFTVSGIPVKLKLYREYMGMPQSLFEWKYEQVNGQNGTITLTLFGNIADNIYKAVIINDDGDRIKYKFHIMNEDAPYHLNTTGVHNITGKVGKVLLLNFTIFGTPDVKNGIILTLNGEEVAKENYRVKYRVGDFPMGRVYLKIRPEVKDGSYKLALTNNRGNKTLDYVFSFKTEKFPFSLDPTYMEDQVFTGQPGVGLHVHFMVGGTPGLEDMYNLTRNGQEVPKDHYNMSFKPGEYDPFGHVNLNMFGVVKDGSYKVILKNDDGDQTLEYDFSFSNEKVLAFLNPDSMDRSYIKKKGIELRINFNVSGAVDRTGFNLTRGKSEVARDLYSVEYIAGKYPNGQITLILTERAKTGDYALMIKDVLEDFIIYEFTYKSTDALLTPTGAMGNPLYWVLVAVIVGMVVALVIIYIIFYTESRNNAFEDGMENDESIKDEEWTFSMEPKIVDMEPAVDGAVIEEAAVDGAAVAVEQNDGEVDAPQVL